MKKPCVKIDPKTGDIIHRYRSITEAAFRNNCSASAISKAIKGRLNTAVGFIWAANKEG